jgi:Aspartyl protease
MREGHTCASVVAVVSLCSLLPLQGAQPDGDMPFDLAEQYLVVAKGSVGGLRGLNLLIDTGTMPSVVDKSVAARLNLRGAPSLNTAFGQNVAVRSTTLPGLRVGPFEHGEVPAKIGDLSYLQRTRVDVIVGLDVLARRSFAIDYRARTLSFGPADRERAVAPLRVVWPFLTVRLFVAGQPVQLLVDTGSRDLVLFKSRMPASLLPVPWKGDKVIQLPAGLVRLLRYDLRQVTLGDQRWESLPGFVLDASTSSYPAGIDGVLGVRAIGGARVRLDFERGELGWSE